MAKIVSCRPDDDGPRQASEKVQDAVLDGGNSNRSQDKRRYRSYAVEKLKTQDQPGLVFFKQFKDATISPALFSTGRDSPVSADWSTLR